MKKLFVGCLCLMAMASCNVKNSDEYKAIQAERDSLLQVANQASSELTETNTLINDIEENFKQIREAEKYLTLESKNRGEMSRDTKSRVKDNFEMINDILKKNKADIEKLNKKINSSSGQMSGLKATVDRLNKELNDRANTIVELQSSLSARDAQIALLQTNIDSISQNVVELSEQTTEQATKIKEQDKELNTAYYMFGTSKELKEAKVVSGGFLVSPKILNEGIEKSKFIRIDIRDMKNIPLYDKKAKLLSDHPKDSYTLDKNSKGEVVINITDYKRFWSLTRFLIVEVG